MSAALSVFKLMCSKYPPAAATHDRISLFRNDRIAYQSYYKINVKKLTSLKLIVRTMR